MIEVSAFKDTEIPKEILANKQEEEIKASHASPVKIIMSTQVVEKVAEKPDPRADAYDIKLKRAINEDDIQEMAELIFEIKDLGLQGKVKCLSEAEKMVYGE